MASLMEFYEGQCHKSQKCDPTKGASFGSAIPEPKLAASEKKQITDMATKIPKKLACKPQSIRSTQACSRCRYRALPRSSLHGERRAAARERLMRPLLIILMHGSPDGAATWHSVRI